MAFLMAAAFFWGSPLIMKAVWPKVHAAMLENQWPPWLFYLVAVTVLHLIFFFVGNLMMYPIYHFKLPFFERYKVNS